jgi:hypothetical protein
MHIGVFASWAGEERQTRRAKALTPNPDATLATAAANWAMWHACERLERERMSQMIEGRAFVTSTAESELNQEASAPSESHPLTATIPLSIAP